MSSNMILSKVCEFCNKDFTAKKTVTKYCGVVCARKAYKKRIRDNHIGASELITDTQKLERIEILKKQKYLTVKELAIILKISKRSAYLYVSQGKIPSVNFGVRCLRISSLELDSLFKENVNEIK
jgi:excisionase family DNA binding protein